MFTLLIADTIFSYDGYGIVMEQEMVGLLHKKDIRMQKNEKI